MRGSAQPLARDSWQLHFLLYQLPLGRLGVFQAVSCPSLGEQVIREPRLCNSSKHFAFRPMMKMEIENRRKGQFETVEDSCLMARV